MSSDRRDEEALARLAAIVESSDDAIIGKTLEGRILSWNTGAERMFGYPADEVIGMPITLLVPRERLDEERALLKRLGRGDRVEHYDTVRTAKDGRRIDVSLTVSPVRDTEGGVAAISTIARDITLKKRAEHRLLAQYEVTRVLADSQTLEQAGPTVLRIVCELLDWDVGGLWYVDEDDEVLRCLEVWHRATVAVPEFEAVSRALTFRPGVGLPGRVWQSARPAWIADVAKDENFPRSRVAAAVGLHGACGFPIVLNRRVLGVVELFSHEVRPPDDELLQLMNSIGSQTGQFIERKRAESALKHSEHRLRLVAETVPSILWTASPDGTITWANGRWLQYCGVAPEHDDAWHERVLHPDDRARWIETWTDALELGTRCEIELRYRRHDGTYRWFETRAVPIADSGGRIVQWSGTTSDVDDRRRAEERSRFLADAGVTLAELMNYESTLGGLASLAIPSFADWCAVNMFDADGTVRCLALTHSDPAQLDLVRNLFGAGGPRAYDPFGAEGVLRTGRPEWAQTMTDTRLIEIAADGEHLRLLRQLGLQSLVCVPLRSRGQTIGALTFATAESGRVYGVTDLAVAEDLASRAVVAIENARLLETLREADHKKDEFLAMLAHELRNPLAPIRNSAQIVRAQAEAVPALRASAEVIDRQVHQMTRLIDDLLDVSRITRGRITLRQERVELATVVCSAIEASRALFTAHGHVLSVTTPAAPIEVDGDSTRLAQVVLNLLNNAAKYTDPGGEIGLWIEPAAGEVVIRVTDTGIGIAPDLLPRIFDLFVQADRSLERSEGGLGIGLTLVQRLVELHGGTVEAHSAGKGRGSEFVVRLPLAAPLPAVAPPARAAEDAAAAGRLRILIVDDNRDSAASLCELLQMRGHEVTTAHDGLAAVTAAETFRPEIVVLDLGLPKLNGFEVARRIREQEDGAGIVLIALTGWGQEEDRRRSKESGFDHHMTKPIEFAALLELLGRGGPARLLEAEADGAAGNGTL